MSMALVFLVFLVFILRTGAMHVPLTLTAVCLGALISRCWAGLSDS